MTNLPIRPTALDADVKKWLKVNNFTGTPTTVAYQNLGYLPRFCHVSAKHHAILNGGKRVHGWAIWRWKDPTLGSAKTMIVAEHHSVWQHENGSLIDVTPPLSQGNSVLFLRDDQAVIDDNNNNQFIMRADRTDIPGLYLYKDKALQSEFYPISFSLPELKAYANQLGFDVKRMATDATHG